MIHLPLAIGYRPVVVSHQPSAIRKNKYADGSLRSILAGMACDELKRLREQATAVKDRIQQQRRKARAQAEQVRSSRPSGVSEYIPFLQRKLQRLSEKIERHVADHGCQN